MRDIRQRIKEYDLMLYKHIENRDFVKFKRTVKEGSADISGFILKMSEDFILIQKELEFYLNGYAIIRKDGFDSIRHNRFDKVFKKILINEGIFDNSYGIDKEINIDTWQTIFKDLRKYDYHVIIECENIKKPTFTIGPIKRVGSKFVSIQYFDPAGLLDSHNTTIQYNDITLVSFDDRYSKVFRKYLRHRNVKSKNKLLPTT